MTINRRTLFGAFALLAVTAVPAIAGATDPLFVNMTTDDPHRASMALTFALNQQRLGHPVTIFFNDKGRAKVMIALAKGKKLHDKRETEKARDWKKEQGRLLRDKG